MVLEEVLSLNRRKSTRGRRRSAEDWKTIRKASQNDDYIYRYSRWRYFTLVGDARVFSRNGQLVSIATNLR